MAVHPLIAECAGLGIRLEPEGPDGLAVEPADRMTPALRARLVAAKAEVLAALRDADALEATVRHRLADCTALLEHGGYRGHPARLPARLRRDLARAARVPSLRAIGTDVEAWRRAFAIVDDWLVRLGAVADRGASE